MSQETKFYRTFNKDGSDNIDKVGRSSPFKDLYHVLLSMRWPFFVLTLISCYLLINLFFASIYFKMGSLALRGLSTDSENFFLDCFFFSVQTLSTIGYGHVSPASLSANVIVAIEAFCGLLSVALMTGLFYARFSRPTAKIAFSEVAVIGNHLGKKSLLFRMANTRLNRIAEASVKVILLKDTLTPEGHFFRLQHDLKMLRSHSIVFAASWLVVHEIDSTSPLYNLSEQDMIDQNIEILIAVTGFDETFSQSIYARRSYISDEIKVDARFADIISRVKGRVRVDIESISKTLPN